ncbi:MAG: hypothetical protein WD004_07900 [Actinomycetota bacterium]
MRKSLGSAVLAGALTLLLAVPAFALEATVIPHRVGARFNVRAHVGSVRYNGTKHVVGGTIGLTNTANRGRTVHCLVVATFKARNGQARVKRDDVVNVRVGPHTTRHPDWQVSLRDTIARWRNQPINAVGHCHLVRPSR